MDTEDVISDAIVRGSVYRERYSKGVATRILRLLEDAEVATIAKLERRLEGMTALERDAFVRGNYGTRRLKSILEQIRDLAKTIRQTVSSEINVSIKDLVEAELAFSKELLGSIGIQAAVGEGVSVTAAVASIRAQPFNGRHLRDWVKEFEPSVRKRMLETMRVGFVTGETTQEIARNLRTNVSKLTKNGSEILAITTLNHFSSRAYEMQYQALGLERIRLLPTLDGRTSIFCRSIDPKVTYPIDKPHPMPPFHPRCRTIPIGVIPGENLSEVPRPYVADKRPVRNIPKGERKGKIGQTRGDITYHEWLERQPAGFARSVLGSTRYKLWKSGKFDVKKFTDMRSHRVYTIAELRTKHGRIFKELGL